MRHLAYDVDVNLRDVVLLASPLHVEFVRALLDWTRAPQLNLRGVKCVGLTQIMHFFIVVLSSMPCPMKVRVKSPNPQCACLNLLRLR